MLVEALMHRDVAVVGRDHTALKVARVMAETHSGSVVVVDERKRPIGIVTDRDLVVRVFAAGKDADAVCVDEFMSTPVHAVDGDALVFDVLRSMARHKVHRMPVIGPDATLMGIVNVSDALLVLTTELANIAEVMGRPRTH